MSLLFPVVGITFRGAHTPKLVGQETLNPGSASGELGIVTPVPFHSKWGTPDVETTNPNHPAIQTSQNGSVLKLCGMRWF